MIPISIGGIGLRELTFLYGAPLMGVSATLGVSAAILLSVLTLLCGLLGLFPVYKKPKEKLLFRYSAF
jgi:hypothetical protein